MMPHYFGNNRTASTLPAYRARDIVRAGNHRHRGVQSMLSMAQWCAMGKIGGRQKNPNGGGGINVL